MARTLLTLSHITYTYPQAAEAALRNVSATFDAGWTAVIGDNGCGKTTLARIACGLVRPDEGTVSARLPFAYCDQDPRFEPATLYDFACDFAPDAVLRWKFLTTRRGDSTPLAAANRKNSR